MTSNTPISVPKSDEELLAQCKVETFRSSGKGGQHANKTESAVRLTHISTSIKVLCQDERSQYQNKMKCLKELRKRIDNYNYIPQKRIQTKPPRSSVINRLNQKKFQSQKKKLRQKPEFED